MWMRSENSVNWATESAKCYYFIRVTWFVSLSILLLFLFFRLLALWLLHDKYGHNTPQISLSSATKMLYHSLLNDVVHIQHKQIQRAWDEKSVVCDSIQKRDNKKKVHHIHCTRKLKQVLSINSTQLAAEQVSHSPRVRKRNKLEIVKHII